MGTSRIDYNKPKTRMQLGGVFDIPYHYEMVSDPERVGRFHEAIRQVSQDKVVLEVGYGTGILSMAALPLARQVYGVELDPRVEAFGTRNLTSTPWASKVKVFRQDVMTLGDADLPWDSVDVVIVEMLSTALVNENQVPVMEMLRHRLRPDCIRLPSQVASLVEGVNAEFAFGDVSVTCHFYEFSGIRKPRLMTESRVFDRIRFDQPMPERCDAKVTFTALVPGTINALRFSSVVSLCPGVTFYSTDSLMPPVVKPLDRPLDVKEGDEVTVRIRYRYNTDWDYVTASATLE